MGHQVFSEELVASVVKELQIADLAHATIGEVLLVASRLEQQTGIETVVAIVPSIGDMECFDFCHQLWCEKPTRLLPLA